jgi:hypothetical protein
MWKNTYNLLEALWISVGAPQICSLVLQERALWGDGILSRWRLVNRWLEQMCPREGAIKRALYCGRVVVATSSSYPAIRI